jgi:multiple sugar transport system ATP-binding protein
MASVTLKSVRKVYTNGAVGVDRADLTIEDGELLVLVGPSGCGKSTLLRMIAGLEQVTEGSVLIGDRDVTNLEPRDRDIAMVFQSYALYPHMTVAENLGFGLKLRGHDTSEIHQRVSEAAQMLELEQLLERLPKQLSGGQRQRVALGRALVRHPKVFLLDEPLSNLDAKLRGSTRVQIARLHRTLGATMIYVTHDQVEAMTLGNRIVVMNKGIIQQVDTPMRIYARPVNLFVAGFLGNPPMNLLKGRLQGTDDALGIEGDGARFALPVSAAKTLASSRDREIVAGVRPENLVRSDTATPLRAKVDLIECVGSESYLHLRLGAWPLVARVAPSEVPEVGAEVSFTVADADLHYFDADSGARIG